MKISFEMTLHLVHFFCFYPEVKVKSGGVVGKVTVGHPVITDSFRHIKSARIFFSRMDIMKRDPDLQQ